VIVIPIVLPLVFTIGCLFFWGKTSVHRVLAVIGAAGLNLSAVWILSTVWTVGIQTLQVGAWPAPFGITLVVDLFSAIMLQVSALVALAVAIYCLSDIDESRVRFGFFPLYFILLMGVNGALITGDLFNLYVWFEVMLMSSFVLIALGGERAQVEGAVKYLILNLLSSILFLSATGLLYNLTGTLNLADLAHRIPQASPTAEVSVIAILFFIAFAIKSAAFPLFFWLPASYHTPPVAVTALFSGLLTKVGVYALVRVFTLLFTADLDLIRPLLLTIAALTMVSGVLGAAVQTDVRRLLSFHIISQIGYLLMGLGLGGQAALAAVVYFMVHVILSKSALFLVAGVVERIQGSFELKELGGLASARPWLAIFFLLPALSLAGLPPLSGFYAKLALILAGLNQGSPWVVATALAVSLLTLYSMTKVWNETFWKERPPSQLHSGPPAPLWLAAGGLAIISLLVGLAAAPVYQLSTVASTQLADSSGYILAVMGRIEALP
jgi:multicomponent Na+:H+ antiporter subunit D